MKNMVNDDILTSIYRERGVTYGNYVNDNIINNDLELHKKLEEKLKEKFNSDEIVDLMDLISGISDYNCETFYKIGFADGIKLEREIEQLKK